MLEDALLEDIEKVSVKYCHGLPPQKIDLERFGAFDIDKYSSLDASVGELIDVLKIENECNTDNKYIRCVRCERLFDPNRITKDIVSSKRCLYCGEKHSLSQLDNSLKTDESLSVFRSTKLYLISNGEHVKIGISFNPEKRLGDIQTSTSKKVELLATCDPKNAGEYESLLHEEYSEFRVRGEWFDLPSAKEKELVERVKAAQGEVFVSL